jgi:TolB-like protein
MTEQRSKRRLTAILAADVVAYSRLMEADEAGTLAALKARRREVLEPLVGKHQGRIFKIAGDGVLVEFASAVNAVQCAVDLQQAFASANAGLLDDRQIVLRIGVNLGDVMVEGGDLYGDGINIAARLEALAEPGGILVSGTAFDHIKSKVKIGFADIGAQILKNIVEPVRTYQVMDTPAVSGIATLPVSDKPSIAVLPFANLSDDPAQDYFSDGLAEDIATELGRFRNLLVISRNSSFVFKGGAVDAKEIARRLGARYILEGSVRRSGNRIRISAQLLESATGNHLWAERYDRNADELFDVQDEITRMVAANLPIHVEQAESARVQHRISDSLSAYDHWLRGKYLMGGDLSEEKVLHAKQHFEKAVEIDPNFGSAYVDLANSCWTEYQLSQTTSRETAVEQVMKLSRRAVEADPRDSRTHLFLAWGYLNAKGDYDLAKVQVEEALALNPNDYYNYCFSGWLAACSGDLEHALACSSEALQRSPLVSDGCLETRVVAEYLAGNYTASITAFGKMLRPSEFIHGWIAAAYAQLGRMEEARAMADEFLKRTANLPQMPKGSDPVEWHRYWDVAFQTKDPAARERLFDGLRMAGLPA